MVALQQPCQFGYWPGQGVEFQAVQASLGVLLFLGPAKVLPLLDQFRKKLLAAFLVVDGVDKWPCASGRLLF